MALTQVLGTDTPNEGRVKINAAIDLLNGMGEVVDVGASRTLQAGDQDAILYCTSSPAITIPSGLAAPYMVMILNVGAGVVSVLAGAGVTLEPGNFTLDNTQDDITVATLVHKGSDVWYGIYGAAAAPRAQVVNVATTLQLTADHDGAMVHLADNATVTLASTIPAGWAVSVTRDGATSGVINRSAGQALRGPGGDQASYAIGTQYLSAAIHSTGSGVFYVDGPVS